MKSEIKTIYKARYVIDVEFTNEPMPKMTDDDLRRMVKIKIESSFRDFAAKKRKDEQEELNSRFDYVEKHFPDAILSLYFQLLWLESFLLETGSLEGIKVGRTSLVNIIKNMAASDVRERITVPKGRTPENERNFFL